MFTAPLTRPAASSASKTVVAFRDRCSSLRLKTTSRIVRAVPAARTAPNDDPYSTRRFSPRWYQTRCGISCTSGWPPVAIEERQTGVRDGKVVTARRYSPSFIRKRSAGVSSVSTARSSMAGVRPSMTIRTSFLPMALVLGERAEARVALARALAQPHSQRGQGDGFDVPDDRDERERSDDDGAQEDEQRSSEPRSSTAQRAAH